MRYKIWDRQETLITPIGEILSPEQVFDKFPASKLENIKYVICDAPINMAVFMEFEATKDHYRRMGANITDDMTDQEVLDAITEFEQTPPPDPEPTPEERLAAAMEFQAMMMLPKEEE